MNESIREETAERIEYYTHNPNEIDERLAELDHEWDIERTLEANASVLILLGLGAGVAADRRYLALPVIVAGFLLQHAIQGWCPPVSIFRRLGVRTQREIDTERRMLKLIRDS